MWLIAGLGNPGSRYANTPHNLGFEVALCLAARMKVSFAASKLCKAEVAKGTIAGQDVWLMMPTTFMNLSGEAVGQFARYYKIHPAHTLTITDDVALPWGKLRLRSAGSHGGHNGLRDIIQQIGTDAFPRIRVGCEPAGWKGTLADYVLCKLGGDALELARHMAQIGADAAEDVVARGIDKAQNKYNGYDATKV